MRQKPSTQEIQFVNGKPHQYVDYTIMPFSSWAAMEAFTNHVAKTNPSQAVNTANRNFMSFVDAKIRKGDTLSYGLFGKYPKTYSEAMSRDKFIYYDEYKKIKESVEQKIREELQKESVVETMKPKLVFNDKGIGEFVFDRAAMSLKPQMYYYSPSKKREIDVVNENILHEGEKMILESDKSLVVFAFKVEKENGEIEYVEIEGDNSLEEATKKGIVDCTSDNKKVYLYKEKKPKIYRGVKIIVGLTAGGFTSWHNDFFTGITAVACLEVLESLGDSVSIEVVMGGGRCSSCHRSLGKSMNLPSRYGRRFFSFTAKSFDAQLDSDSLLYTLCDPSFHNIRFMSILNNFFKFFGDSLDASADPRGTWHGIEAEDMINPIGMYYKFMDDKNGNKDLLHFYIHKVGSEATNISERAFIAAGETAVAEAVLSLVLECENKNKQALEKFSTHDFGLDN